MSDDHEIEFYEEGVASADNKVPRFLIFVYAILPFWGLITFYLYWNGSYGWLDRGYWQQLQTAANTTFPQVNWTEALEEKR